MILYLVRHGQSEGNVLQKKGLDPPMTQLGIRQIHLAAQRMQKEEITHFYSSPLYRALESMEIYREYFGKEPVISPLFCEIWGSHWHARSVDELKKRFPWAHFPKSMAQDRWWPIQEESRTTQIQRIRQAIELIFQNHLNRNDRICLISHVEMGNVFWHVLLGLECNGKFYFQQRNAACTKIEMDNNQSIQVCYMNDVTHLSADLWT